MINMLSFSYTAVSFLIVSGVIAVIWTLRFRIADRFGKINSEPEKRKQLIFGEYVLRLKMVLKCTVVKELCRVFDDRFRDIRTYTSCLGYHSNRKNVVSPFSIWLYSARRGRSAFSPVSLKNFICAVGAFIAGFILSGGRKLLLVRVPVSEQSETSGKRKL